MSSFKILFLFTAVVALGESIIVFESFVWKFGGGMVESALEG